MSANPNFIRPDDPRRAAGTNTNFVSREAANIRASEVEGVIGTAVRRQGESETAFKKRSKAMERERVGVRSRSQMSPAIARRELAQLEQKWAGKTPTEQEAQRFRDEFDYMNDCRVAIGWPEIDYTRPREPEGGGDAVQERFIAFKKKPERERLHLCVVSDDLSLMRLASIHDTSENVRSAAERRWQDLWAQKSAAPVA